MPDVIRISATAAGISYYPEHVARGLGFFRDEGLTVQTEAPGHGPWVARAVAEGKAEMALGGIWRPLMYRGRLDTFVSFAQICVRCPAVVLSRRPMPRFRWRDLAGKRVMVPDGSPTPLIALVAVLRAENVDPARVKLIQHFLSEEARDLYKGGLGDFYVASPPASDLLVAEGHGHQVADLAEAGGRLPWSLYYSLPSFLERPGNLAGRFARAIDRALKWTRDHDPEEAPQVLSQHYPKLAPELAIRAVKICKTRDIWPASARMAPTELAQWQRILVDSDLIDEAVPYAEAFDRRAVDWAVANPVRT